MEILEKLFGSAAKVKIMRLFLFNPEHTYDTRKIEKISKVRGEQVRKEVSRLEKTGLIKRKVSKNKITFALDSQFPYLKELQNLLINMNPIGHQDMIKRFNKVGKIKGMILSGVFIQYWDGRADIVIIGDKLKKTVLEGVIKNIEAEIGKELKYAALETADFKYRVSIGDRLIRDVLDYPHEVIFDKVGIQ